MAKLPPLASRHSASESHGGKADRLSNASTWPLLAAMKRSRYSRGKVRTGATLGSTSARSIFESTVLADPARRRSPGQTSDLGARFPRGDANVVSALKIEP